MLLNARFAALVVFCGVAVNPLCSNGTTGVHAAVIARDAQRDGVDNHSNDVDQKQTHFSSPWSHKTNHSSSKHKVVSLRASNYLLGG
ncbi:hypothetical protein CPB83DRAFT_853468 [Crepidotus variabilis]|uniref:Secreted protein n=1 Tax=Crepidotus variabilis TaxID=179855 RepID=A0A9P6EHB9_9AGAR|nr:hypothetical protein CPB83DRAFT_853468 [Crepidotus variabilis]